MSRKAELKAQLEAQEDYIDVLEQDVDRAENLARSCFNAGVEVTEDLIEATVEADRLHQRTEELTIALNQAKAGFEVIGSALQLHAEGRVTESKQLVADAIQGLLPGLEF